MLTPRLRGLLERIASSPSAVIRLEDVPETLGLPLRTPTPPPYQARHRGFAGFGEASDTSFGHSAP